MAFELDHLRTSVLSKNVKKAEADSFTLSDVTDLLQASRQAFTLYSFPFIDWLGLYLTVETFLPQLTLLLIILFMGIWIKKRNQTT